MLVESKIMGADNITSSCVWVNLSVCGEMDTSALVSHLNRDVMCLITNHGEAEVSNARCF
jgi:hypothetical protein